MPSPSFKDRYDFLSFEQSNPAHYTFDPRYGYKDIDAFSEGEPCWRPLLAEEFKVRATLILGAYFFSQWEYEKVSALQILLNELIDEGFVLYQWHSGSIRLLDEALIEQLHEGRDAQHYCVPTPDVLMDYIERHTPFSKKEVCLLDDYKIDWLLSGKRKAPQRVLSCSYFEYCTLVHNSYISYLESAQPTVSEIRLTSYTPNHLRVFKKLKRAFPSVVYLNEYDTLTLTPLWLDTLMSARLLVNEGVSFTIQNLMLIKKLTFLSPRSCSNVFHTLQSTRILTHLVLEQQASFPEGDFSGLCLAELTQLTLLGGSISVASLNSLISCASNLKTLSMEHCVISGDIERLILPESIQINLSKQSISFEHLLELSRERQSLAQALTQGYETEPAEDSDSDFDVEPMATSRPFYNQAQTQIIEKLGVYLKLRNQNLSIIPLIQVGICVALAQLFKDTVFDLFSRSLLLVSAWDRSEERLGDDLAQIFIKLRDYIEQYQLNQTGRQIYLGNALPSFLGRNHTVGAAFILGNHCHAVSIRFQGHDNWLYYDPNCPYGVRELKTVRLVEVLNTEQGSLISIRDNNDSSTNNLPSSGLISDPAQFIRDGGLIKLVLCKNVDDLLHILPSPAACSLMDLNGLFVPTAYGAPAWVACIVQKNQAIIHYTLGLISAYMTKNPSFQVVFYDSLSSLSFNDRDISLDSLTALIHASDSPFKTPEHRTVVAHLEEAFLEHFYDHRLALEGAPTCPLFADSLLTDDAVSDNFSIHEGYDWPNLTHKLRLEPAPRHDALILNPSTLDAFFHQVRCENNTLIYLKGHIEATTQRRLVIGHYQAAPETPLVVRLTRALSKAAWVLLLQECHRFNVQLICFCSPGIFLPEELLPDYRVDGNDDNEIDYTPVIECPWSGEVGSASLVINSTDVDTTVALLTQYHSDYLVIDVSAYEHYELDLFQQIRGVYNFSSASFDYTCAPGWLSKALEGGKKVILKGRFSAKLCDVLAPVLLAPTGPEQTLILVSEETRDFNYVRIHTHKVDVACKRTVLEQPWFKRRIESMLEREVASLNLSTLDEFIEEPLSKLIKRLVDASMSEQRMALDLPMRGEFDSNLSEADLVTVIRGRENTVRFILRHAPLLILNDPLGLGISTFVHKHLNVGSVHLNISDWARSTPSNNQLVILLMHDVRCDLRQFEGLATSTPGIFIKDEYYSLTPLHRVIFAQHPHTMDVEPSSALLFERHAHKVLFKPLSMNCIYEYLLKPLFVQASLESHAAEIARIFFRVYDFIATRSSGKTYMTPRDLQMMALLLLSRDAPALENALYYAYVVGKERLPPGQCAAFDALFFINRPLSLDNRPMNVAASAAFLLTPSRHAFREQLMDLLALREYKANASLTNAQRYGGLAAVILEGPMGCGKKALVRAALMDAGYHEGNFNLLCTDEEPSSAPCFYLMPENMPYSDQATLLFKAFCAGAVVLGGDIDYSFHEPLLYSLLEGITPMGKRPAKAGFLLIGTRNPQQEEPSNALSKHFLKIQIPDYTVQEMHDILMRQGSSERSIHSMLSSYERQVAKARLNEQAPPTFHMLISIAQEIQRYQQYNPVLLTASDLVSSVVDNDDVDGAEPNQVDLAEPDNNEETGENMDAELLTDDPLPMPGESSPSSKRRRGDVGFFSNPDRQGAGSGSGRSRKTALDSASEYVPSQP